MMIAMFVINVDHTDEDDPDKNAMYIYSCPKFSPPLDNFGRPCLERCQKVLVVLKFLKISIASG